MKTDRAFARTVHATRCCASRAEQHENFSCDTMICVPIAEASFARMAERLESCMDQADMVEIRLDALSEPCSASAVKALIGRSSIPILFTCRRSDEGGAFGGSEQQRIQCLMQAVDAGAQYVDVELRTGAAYRDEVINHAHSGGCHVIMSWHDFKGTPPEYELASILREQKAAGADIAKIVTMGVRASDIPRLFTLYYLAQELDIPLVSFCMGDIGRISRVACLAMGGWLTFASLDSGSGTAPGQIPLARFRNILTEVL